MSRNIGLEPFPSGSIIVYSFCLGVVTSQHIHFHGFSPPTDCVSLYKTYIGCILHILDYIDANFDGQYSFFGYMVWSNHVKVCWTAVYLCIPETGPQNGVGWLLPKVTCLPTYFFDWDTIYVCMVNRWQNLMMLGLFVWEIWALNYISVDHF